MNVIIFKFKETLSEGCGLMFLTFLVLCECLTIRIVKIITAMIPKEMTNQIHHCKAGSPKIVNHC